MNRIVKTLVAIVAGSAVVLIPASSLSRSYGTTLQPALSRDCSTFQIKNYVPQPPQQDKKEPAQTAYLNLIGAFGNSDIKIYKLPKTYIP